VPVVELWGHSKEPLIISSGKYELQEIIISHAVSSKKGDLSEGEG
jgi:hypothetical protein